MTSGIQVKGHPNLYMAHRPVDKQAALRSYDPASSIQKQVKTQSAEIRGYLISLTFEPVDFFSYEIWSFIENQLHTHVYDLSIFRDDKGKPTGIVVVQFLEEVTTEKLKLLHGADFKGSTVYVRVFSSFDSFQSYIYHYAKSEVENISLPLLSAVPTVYVQGFVGKMNDVLSFFGRCGKIIYSTEEHYPNESDETYFILYYSTEVGARHACKLFMGYSGPEGELLVSPFYPRSAERSIAIRFCNDVSWLQNQISRFGDFDLMKGTNDGTIYVLMNNIQNAKLACILMNGLKCGSQRITTHFVDYEYFSSIM